MFSGEFREISKKTFFIEHLWATASQKNVNRTNITPTLRNVSILWQKSMQKLRMVKGYIHHKKETFPLTFVIVKNIQITKPKTEVKQNKKSS